MTGVRLADDWHVAGYEAALRRDHESMCATLNEIAGYGRAAMETALRAWMDRTELVMVTISRSRQQRVGFVLEADNGDGDPVDPDQAPTWVTWSARMFMAHVDKDQKQQHALWTAVPDDQLRDALYAALNMLALTAASLAAAATAQATRATSPEPVPDPMIKAARMSRAHLN